MRTIDIVFGGLCGVVIFFFLRWALNVACQAHLFGWCS